MNPLGDSLSNYLDMPVCLENKVYSYLYMKWIPLLCEIQSHHIFSGL